LIWDDWNIEHIATHDVTDREVEEACEGRTRKERIGGSRV
jgi:hypothetical protein